MLDFQTLLQQGNAWLYVPSAIVLGALHGLEPGHSKTMMAAFIIAVRGTLFQAILLGLAATLSHTAVVWLIALGGLYFGQRWSAEASEPYLQLGSAVLIIGVALWMLWRMARRQPACFHEHGPASHDHDHGHAHGNRAPHQALAARAACAHTATPFPADPHEQAHAQAIRDRFENRHVTTGQIALFGLTGGLIPCPASITVLLLCLQLKKVGLGAALVLSFSAGLALSLVASGVLAALSVRHVSKRWSGFGTFASKAPYFSSALILLVGLYVGYLGLSALMAR